MTQLQVGIAFALPILLFTIAAIFMHHLTNRTSKQNVIFIGLFIIVIALALTGPLLILPVEPALVYSVSGFLLMGLGAAFIEIPVIPELIEAVEEDY